MLKADHQTKDIQPVETRGQSQGGKQAGVTSQPKQRWIESTGPWIESAAAAAVTPRPDQTRPDRPWDHRSSRQISDLEIA